MTKFSPVGWRPPKHPKLEGVFAINKDLAAAELWPSGKGPEDVAVDDEGFVYTGLENGNILKFRPDGSSHQILGNTGGRPLGVGIHPAGGVLVCGAYAGMLHVADTGTIEEVLAKVDGTKLLLTNNASIARDGRIFFTESSQRWELDHFTEDLLEMTSTGRLLVLHPNGDIEELISDLCFANGVALSPDESFVLVAETGRFNIHRHWLSGPKAATNDVWLTNLPGFPDNLSQDDGVVWCAFPRPRDAQLDMLQSKPRLKSIVMKLPASMQPSPSRHGFVLGFDLEGNVVHNLQDTSGKVAVTTGVRASHGKLYIGSLSDPTIAVLEMAGR